MCVRSFSQDWIQSWQGYDTGKEEKGIPVPEAESLVTHLGRCRTPASHEGGTDACSSRSPRSR